MRAHLDAETARRAAIWRITRMDGAPFLFIDPHRSCGSRWHWSSGSLRFSGNGVQNAQPSSYLLASC
jgi:hypothetical protein